LNEDLKKKWNEFNTAFRELNDALDRWGLTEYSYDFRERCSPIAWTEAFASFLPLYTAIVYNLKKKNIPRALDNIVSEHNRLYEHSDIERLFYEKTFVRADYPDEVRFELYLPFRFGREENVEEFKRIASAWMKIEKVFGIE